MADFSVGTAATALMKSGANPDEVYAHPRSHSFTHSSQFRIVATMPIETARIAFHFPKTSDPRI
jgi:hypothetical protein